MKKGERMSDKQKKKISESLKGHLTLEATRKKIGEKSRGRISWNKGKKLKPLSEEHKKKISKANKGARCNNWKGGITPFRMKVWKSEKYQLWRKTVFERDNYACWICEHRGGYLEVHHLKSFVQYPKLRFVVSNGLILCRFCHITYTQFRPKIIKKTCKKKL